MVSQQLREDVAATDSDTAFPGEVIEADVVQLHVLRRHAEHGGERALESDRDVAQADGPVSCLQQGAGDDADRVGEVDDPGLRVAACHLLGDVENHRHRPQGFREPACTRRLLADAAALERPRLVALAGRLSTDAQLKQHGIGILHSRRQVGRRAEATRVSLGRENAARQPADQLEPLGGRVDQHQLVDREHIAQTGEPVDQLRRIGGSATHDGQLHPLTPVRVTPSTKARCAKKNTIMTGAITRSVAAIVRFQSVWWAPLKDSSP